MRTDSPCSGRLIPPSQEELNQTGSRLLTGIYKVDAWEPHNPVTKSSRFEVYRFVGTSSIAVPAHGPLRPAQFPFPTSVHFRQLPVASPFPWFLHLRKLLRSGRQTVKDGGKPFQMPSHEGALVRKEPETRVVLSPLHAQQIAKSKL